MEANKRQPTPLIINNNESTWKPFDWNESPNFLNSTAQGRQMLESYREAKRQEAEKQKQRKAEENRIAEIRRQDRERQRKNAKIYRKRNEERQRQYEEERKAQKEKEEEYKKLSDEVEEKNFSNWADGKWWKDNFFGRRYFDLKNQIGSLVTGSIDTNGTTIQGKISMNELRKQAADAHNKMLDLQESLESIKQQRALYDEVNLTDPERMRSNKNDQKVRKYWEGRSKFDNAIKQVEQRMSDPTIKGLDDAYKQLYVLDKRDTGSNLWQAAKDLFTEAVTFDEYIPQVRARRKQELLKEYDKLMINEQSRLSNEKYLKMPFDVAAKQIQRDRSKAISKIIKSPEEYSLENRSKRLDTERKVAEGIKQKADAEIEELRQEYIENRTHLRDSEEFWDVAEGFKMNIQAHQNDNIWNPYYFKYNLAPMIGSSMSSPSQAIASAIKGGTTVAGLALAPFSEGASLSLMYLGELAATPFELQGGFDENYGEVGERRIDNIQSMLKDSSFTGDGDELKKGESSTYDKIIKELKNRSASIWKQKGWKDEWIKDHIEGEEGDRRVLQDYISGITSGAVKDDNGKQIFGEFAHPAFQRALILSTAGLQAQFDADNMRTMGELPVQKGLALMPTKWLKKGSDIIDKQIGRIGNKIASTIKKDATGRVTATINKEGIETGAKKAATNRYTNGFRRNERTFGEAFKSGWEKGAEAGDMLGFGYAGHVIGGLAGGTAEGLAHAGRAALNPRLRSLFDGIEEKAMIKYQGILDKLTPEKAWQKALLKYGLNATGRNVGIGFSEAAEEAVQYLNSKEDFAGKYGWSGMSLGDMIMNDIHQGGRVFDAYMSLVGLSNSPLKDDEEYWSNLKGGFILGALPLANPSGIIQVAGNTVRGYKEYKTHDAIITSGVMKREHDKIDRASNAEFARQAFHGNEAHVLEVLNQMEASDRRRENPFLTQEDYDEKRKAAIHVMNMTKDKDIRGMLEAKGIQYGTERYANAIADIYNTTNSLQENSEQAKDTELKRKQIYNSEVFQHAVNEVIDRVMNESSADRREVDDFVKKAGDDAVISEIDAIREELQLDPNSKKYSRIINKPEYKQRISEAREKAEEIAKQQTRMSMRDSVIAKTKLVNRLSSLIQMKARQNTIEDFYTFLHDKFGLSPMRPDAKTVRDNVDKQIKEAKSQLAELTKDTANKFESNFTDAQALDYLDSAQDIVHTKEEDLQFLEASRALLLADKAVSQSYYNQFIEGLVKNKENKWEYNPVEYKKKQDRDARRKDMLLKGDVDSFKADIEAEKNDQWIPANSEDISKDGYGRRVDAIIEANKRNQTIDWAINEVVNGDAVNKFNEVFEEERRKDSENQIKEEKQQEQTIDQEANPFEKEESEQSSEQSSDNVIESTNTRQETPSSDNSESAPQQTSEQDQTKWERTSEKRKAQLQKNREKYEARKQRAKEIYERNKKRYNNWKKGNLNSTVIPFQDAVVKAANALIQNAKIGSYKFSQLVEDFKEIAEDIDIKDVLPILKRQYNKKYAYYTLNDNSILENLSSPEEVTGFNIELTPINTEPEPATIPLHKRVQDTFNKEQENIVKSISTHFDIIVDDGTTRAIYVNEEAVYSSKKDYRNIEFVDKVEKLKAANTSDDNFRRALSELSQRIGFPIEEYVKYRDLDGIEEAIARNLQIIPNEYIENGIKVRNAVVSILLGNKLDPKDFPFNFKEFEKDILDLKSRLEGLNLIIVNTGEYIYGTNKNGKRVASNVDIVAADSTGKIYIIDVRSGYKQMRDRWKNPIKPPIVEFSIEDQEREQLKQIEDIVVNKFGIPVKALYCLPVVYDTRNSSTGIFVEKDKNGKFLIPVKTIADNAYSEGIEQQKKNVKDLIDQINENIKDYNILVKEAKKYIDGYSELGLVEFQEYETPSEYSTYIEVLHSKYDDLSSRINDLRQAIQNSIDAENTVWNENVESIIQDEPSFNTVAYAQRLAEVCNELDIVLQYVPNLKATTKAEKENVNKLYQVIFDAQKALDDLLQDPNASNFDVRAEEELIATAMEVLTENKENFGAMSMFMRRWWANNFVIGQGGNTQQEVLSVAQQTAGFINTINSWVDTLTNHVLQDLDNHEALQEWYSSILNRYFSKLLENAQDFADKQDPILKASIESVIKRGKAFIDQFNDQQGVFPDEDFPGPPANEVEEINRMPVKWKDLYTKSTSHSPAFDAMANSTIYYIMSTSPTFVNGAKSQVPVTENPEDKSTRFNLYEDKSGEIKLRINWWDGNQWKYEELPFTINIGNYPNATTEDIARYTAVNRANKKFTRKVKRMLEYISKHPEYKIEFTVSTDKGSINYNKNGQTFNVNQFLFRDEANKHDLYTIKLSAEDRMGIGRFIKVFNPDRTLSHTFYDIRAGKDLNTRIGSFDENYSKQHLNTQNGAIIYLYDFGDGNTIGVPLQSSQIGLESATKLVDLINKYRMGDRVVQGYDIMTLLSQRLYISDPSRQLSKYNNTNNMVTINNDGTIVIGNESYDIMTQRNSLIQKFAKMSNVINAEALSDNMTLSNNQVLQQAKSIFQNNPSTQTITLPNGFVINREDFTHKNNDGSTGSTWLGYLLRNNLLVTRATSKSYRQVNIDNLTLVDKNHPIQMETKPSVEDRTNARRRRISSLSSIDDPFANSKGSLAMTINEEDIDKTRGVEEQELFVQAVREYFKTVFGTDSDVIFEDAKKNYINEASKNQRIIGLCTSEMVKLSRYAPYSAMYHEAFHKILELVLPEEKRKDFYKIYRSHTKNGNLLSEREVAEGLADLFVDYMSNKILPKNAKWYNKLFRWFKSAGFAMNMAWNYGIVNTRKMYTVYQNMNAGTYANKEISKENADRFKKEFGEELYYTVNGINLQHIADSGQLTEMAKALGYYILQAYDIDQIDPEINFKIDEFTPNIIPSDIMDSLIAEGVPTEELTAVDLAFREILKKGKRIPIIGEKGKYKGKTMGYKYEYPNFNAVSKAVSDYISGIVGEYTGKIIEESEQDDGENRPVQQMNIDRYDKASYEFSKLESVNKRVKLFFSTIPYCTFDENGRIVEDYSRNIFECPVYMPLEEVYNVIVNKLHDVQDITDLNNKLRILAEHDPMCRAVYSKYNMLVSRIYTQDKDGNVKTDYDREAFAIQILSAIRSQKLDFITAISKTSENGKEVKIVSSSLDRDSKRFPKQWSQFLQAGQVGVFSRNRDKNDNFVFLKGMGGANGTDVFSRTAKFMSDLRMALSQSNDTFVIDGNVYNKDTLENIALIKQELLSKLHQIGIMFSREALDYMLLTQYGNMGSSGMLNWLSQTGPSSINTFLDKLNSFTLPNGVPNKSVIERGYTDIGFVRNLAKWQGAYGRITTQQMALGLNGKRLYSVSQNSSISHIVNMLNTEDMENETIRTLMQFGYNITNEEIPQGSIILKAIRSRKPQHIEAHTYIGFKTDNRGDNGSEYTEEATIEDYIAKMTMLQSGYLIFPTLADKGTWMVLSIKDENGGLVDNFVPGIEFQTVHTKDENGKDVENVVVNNAPTVKWFDGQPYLIPSDAVLNQMLEYARTERLTIQQCMEDLGYNDIPGYEKQGRLLDENGNPRALRNEEKIKNYHTPNKDKKTKKIIEPNGTRFLSLTKIVVKEVENGKSVLKEYNLNDPNKSSVELLKLANDKLFNKSIEEQREIMALTLAIQNRHEVQTAIDLGIVERVDVKGTWKSNGKEVSNIIYSEDKNFMNLETKHMNEQQISALTKQIMRQIPSKYKKEDGSTMSWFDLPNGKEKMFKHQIARSLAIAAILGDVTNKSIISSQEIQRCFSGHPAEFKVDYDVANGKIKDSAYDIQKRIGGMISTGDDNVLTLHGIPSTYTCAECNDYEVSSASDIAKHLEKMFVDSQVKEMFANKILQLEETDKDIFDRWKEEVGISKELDAYKIAYMYDSDWIRENAPSSIKPSIDKAEKDGQKFASSYQSGINVADGASYITDKMCENMLRMRGAYDEKVKNAFDILRSNEKYSWMDKRDAYKKIYDAVNIVTTKYTAYGFRNHTLNGNQVSDVSVAYYNKFALFPLFPCIATGRMKGIYEEMIKQEVDMLFMTSAVKVGSQGPVSFDGTKIDKPFNKYVQSYAYLRRQLNTDPEEGDKIVMGTQMVKIGLQNLRLNRKDYTHSRTGKNISGKELLNSMMGSIKKLAVNGMYELQDMFFEDGTNNIDPEKLSKYLKSQLSSRNANKGIIEAIEVTTDPETGKKKLVCPLAATADASWIESILISTINRRIIDIVTPGSSFVQRSVFAIEGGENEGSIQSDKDMSPEINNGERLQMINEDNSMDAVVSMDYFDDIIFKGKLSNMSFNEKRKWLFDNGIIGKRAKANTIGYRIPTQAQSSIHALRFVDVVPAVKSTIILPEEFTKITGSDFDIDHLYLASYNYNVMVTEDGQQVVTTSFNPLDEDGKYDSLYHQNNILDCLITLLKDTDNSINSLYKSIDNDTELITSIADQVPETGSTKDEPYNFGTLHEQVIRKNDYITGKTGIGPFALNVTNQVLTQLYGVKFKDTEFTRLTGISRLDHIIDNNDNFISSWLSAFINAHVDIVKDPYISRLNVNPFTYNMVNLLIRSGFGDVAVWFVAQPIIRDMAAASQQAKSQYARDPEKGKSTFAATEYAIKNALSKYLTDAEMSPEVINKYTMGTDKKSVSVRIELVNYIKNNEKILSYIARYPNSDVVKLDGVEYNVKDVQRNVFYAWKILEKYSIALGDLVQHTKIDTRKHGKTLIEINQYLDAYDKLFKNDSDSSLWDMRSLKNLSQGSWIDLKTRLAISAPSKILSNQTFAANPEFIKAVIAFGNVLSTTKGVLSTDTLNLISRSLQTAVKSKYIVKYAKEKLGMSDKDIAGLFIGKNSINNWLTLLKTAIETKPEFARLKNNHLLNQIFAEIQDDPIVVRGKLEQKPAFITVLSNVDDSKVSSDLLIDGWVDLLNDEHPNVRLFARKLIIYSFLTSGEFKGWNKMFKYVPPAWIRGEIDTDFQSFSDYIQNALLMSSSDYYQFFDDIASNNFMDYRISRRVPKQNADGTENFISATSIIKIGKEVNKKQIYSLEKYITVKEDAYAGKGVSAYSLYKLVSYIEYPNSVLPVYVKIPKKGYHGKNKFDIYEYGWKFGYAENENESANNFDFDSAIERVTSNISKVVYDSDDEKLARAITDLFLDRIDPETLESQNVENQEVAQKQEEVFNQLGSMDDSDNFNNIQESEKIISSEKTILSNEELKYWNKNGLGSMPRILVGSERTDPAFHVNQILDILDGKTTVTEWGVVNGKRTAIGQLSGKDFAGLYLITKHDGIPMLKLLQTKIPKLIHFSITGLGGTKWEPGVMKYNDLLDRIEDYIKQGLDPECITIRIDPIVPGVTKKEDIENIVKRASGMGINRIRFSIMDAYTNTQTAMKNLGYNFEAYYDKDSRGNYFHAKDSYINDLCDFMLSLKDKYGVTLGTCAERVVRQGISKEGCLSVGAVNNMLGTSIEDKGTENNTQRKLCTCYGGKVDALQYNKNCASHCVYCYAKHENDKALEYYNEDGTLKDNNFTRTRYSQSTQTQQQPEQNITSTANDYVMQSGGAYGADTVWGRIASEFGINNQNHWYSGERGAYNAPNGNIKISQEDYNEGSSKVAEAAKMNWGYQYDTMKDDRLIRNWAQVKYADAVFAVGHLIGKGGKIFPNKANDNRVAETTVVQGGTGYAVSMAILEGKPVYVFDQIREKWAANIDGVWQWLTEAPVLTKKFAGIGTRSINAAGEQAIRDVFEKTFGDKNEQIPEEQRMTEAEREEAKNNKKMCEGE